MRKICSDNRDHFSTDGHHVPGTGSGVKEGVSASPVSSDLRNKFCDFTSKNVLIGLHPVPKTPS